TRLRRALLRAREADGAGQLRRARARRHGADRAGDRPAVGAQVAGDADARRVALVALISLVALVALRAGRAGRPGRAGCPGRTRGSGRALGTGGADARGRRHVQPLACRVAVTGRVDAGDAGADEMAEVAARERVGARLRARDRVAVAQPLDGRRR